MKRRLDCSLRRAGLGLFVRCGVCLMAMPWSGCPKPDVPPETDSPTAPTKAPALADSTEETSSPAPIPFEVEADDPKRWLLVEKVHKGAAGAWATGSFDPKRNKIVIQTQDVERFAINVGRMEIDWRRLVVIRINDINSELRKRDFTLYRFVQDDHGQWVVLDR